ncbi:YegS/Rv2252/BmrU family lipid kinase [Natroniella acetigena]|uniref:YegS/Rv2252/BmrU family lipid kinase n=1 Tax=Natroniella acetigena TaxID=52004 RepID=UPI00200AD5B9|nr:YegS/Rv2252/BmrU family lipid kinase [Natroniella acetigena]MCK8826449.1 YegS/Rv2252/BmrU family lipid kinase [Natroniella acetigena]
MKKVKLIYNPMAGNRNFRYYLDQFIEKFQGVGYEVSVFRSAQEGDLDLGVEQVINQDYDLLVVAGGDGSVNEVINAMMKHDIDLPLGIIPAGTANDFAVHLGMPADIETCFDVILEGEVKQVDLGEVNGRYFINVCAGGLLANVSHEIDLEFKNTLGKLGYYLKGIEQLPKFKPIPVEIKTKEQVIEEDIYLFLILNGKSAGGFKKIGKKASITDGQLDLIAVKAQPLHEIALLFIKILQGEHLADENIIYLKDSCFEINCLDQSYSSSSSDVDGEKGPQLPLQIFLHSQALKVVSNISNV